MLASTGKVSEELGEEEIHRRFEIVHDMRMGLVDLRSGGIIYLQTRSYSWIQNHQSIFLNG